MDDRTPLISGQVVFVRSKDTHLLEKPNFGSKRIGLLQPGTQVMWIGAADKEFHKVRVGTLSGFIYRPNLSRAFPNVQFERPKCKACNGTGHMLLQGVDTATWGNNFVHPPCPTCGGTGLPPAMGNAYPSYGEAIKG